MFVAGSNFQPVKARPSSLDVRATTTVAATVSGVSGPFGVAYDSGKGEIFVTDAGPSWAGNTVSIISDSTNTVVATVSVGSDPIGVAYDFGKGEVFVTNWASGTVSVISDSTNVVVATVSVGSEPAGVAYDSGKGEIFVANYVSGTVSVILDSTNGVVATVSVGTGPFGVAYDSGKGEIFVANRGSGTVSVISDSTNGVVTTVSVGSNPIGVAYDSGKGEIFVANSASSTAYVISDSTNSVVAAVSVGTSPWSVAYDSGKGEVFVTNGGSGTVSVISDSTNAVVTTVLVGTNPNGVAYDSGKGEIFVTNWGSNTVSVISDHSALVAPSVSSSPGTVYQNQTSTLNSTVVTTGVPPCEYQWFSEAPGASSYSSIVGATSSSYNFVTSTSTTLGVWSFILQVTDNTGAAVNSTAITVTVNAASLSSSTTIYIGCGWPYSGNPPQVTSLISFKPPYTYTFMSTITGYSIVVAHSSVVLDGNGLTLSGPSGGTPATDGVYIPPGNNSVTIKNMNIVANFLYDVFVNCSSGDNIIDNSIYTCQPSNGGISIDGIFLNYSSRINISFNNFAQPPGSYQVNGIALNSSSNNSISHNNILGTPPYWPCYANGIYLSNSSNNSIFRNDVQGNGNGISLNCSSSINLVGNNTIENNDNCNIFLNYSLSNTIGNNTMFNGTPVTCGIFSELSANNTIINDTIEMGMEEGIYFASSFKNIIFNDTIEGCTGCGIDLYCSPRIQGILSKKMLNKIINNTIEKNNVSSTAGVPYLADGICLTNSSYDIISGNTIEDNYKDAIALNRSSCYNSISNNTIENNGCTYNGAAYGNGIALDYSSNYTSIGNNTITANINDGIALNSSSYNTIFNNNIKSNNNDGIYLHYSSGNLIFHNNFISNINYQAVCDSYINSWNESCLSDSGNFWSDYSNNPGYKSGQYWINSAWLRQNDIDYHPLTGPWPLPLTVSFSESGLTTGTLWSVTLARSLNVVTQSSTSTSITFNAANGASYTFSVTASGYTAYPSSSSITVSGANVIVYITFIPHPPTGAIIALLRGYGPLAGGRWRAVPF